MSIESINPATGDVLEVFEEWPAEKTQRVVAEVHGAWLKWRQTTFARREELMKKVAAVLRESRDAYARMMALEMGKPISEGRAEVEKCASLYPVTEFFPYAPFTATAIGYNSEENKPLEFGQGKPGFSCSEFTQIGRRQKRENHDLQRQKGCRETAGRETDALPGQTGRYCAGTPAGWCDCSLRNCQGAS